MISYVLFGVNDFEKSRDYYDAVLGELGAKRGIDTGRVLLYTTGKGPMMGICRPVDGQKATHGNGTMIAINMPDRAAVERMLAFAVERGGNHMDDHGIGSEKGFYGRYIRDFDDNKICFYHM